MPYPLEVIESPRLCPACDRWTAEVIAHDPEQGELQRCRVCGATYTEEEVERFAREDVLAEECKRFNGVTSGDAA